MDTIFTRGPSLNNRLTLALVLSVVLIFVDHKLDGFKSTRVYLNSLMSPLQYLANLPGLMLNESAQRLTSQEQLLSENQKLNKSAVANERKAPAVRCNCKRKRAITRVTAGPSSVSSREWLLS